MSMFMLMKADTSQTPDPIYDFTDALPMLFPLSSFTSACRLPSPMLLEE